MTAEKTLPLSMMSLQYFVIPWIGLALVHAIWMCIDWRLRVSGFPQKGGLPEGATTVFQIGSLVAFAATVYYFASFMGIVTHILFAVAELIVAACLLLYAWILYALGHSIDTL